MISRLSQTVPIDSDRTVASSLAFSAAVLKRGYTLVWFPEGMRSASGQLQPFKPGIGLLLEHYRVPVVPVFIHGTYQALPMGKFWPRFSQITITFGQPLNPDTLEQQGQGEHPYERIAQALHERVAELGRQVEAEKMGQKRARQPD